MRFGFVFVAVLAVAAGAQALPIDLTLDTDLLLPQVVPGQTFVVSVLGSGLEEVSAAQLQLNLDAALGATVESNSDIEPGAIFPAEGPGLDDVTVLRSHTLPAAIIYFNNLDAELGAIQEGQPRGDTSLNGELARFAVTIPISAPIGEFAIITLDEANLFLTDGNDGDPGPLREFLDIAPLTTQDIVLIQIVPEPPTLLLMLGLVACITLRRRAGAFGR